MLKKTATVTATAAALLMSTFGSPVFANGWGGVTCSETPTPDCQLGAGTPGASGGSGHGHVGAGHHPGPGHGASGSQGSGGDSATDGGSDLANCAYVPSDYQPPSGVTAVGYLRRLPRSHESNDGSHVDLVAETWHLMPTRQDAGPVPGQQGSWYVWRCTGPGNVDAVFHPPIWIAAGQPAPGRPALPSPAQMAQVALRQLRLPTPGISANPAGEQLVRLPTWMWLSAGWQPVSATAAVPGVSVTATATPMSVSWSMGDGHTVQCAGRGTPFPGGTNPAAPSPDCGHTYSASSAGQPGQAYSVSATVHWKVTWAGAGQNGVFPDMTTTANAAFRVAEAQALNTG
jgi:hypothetical protein